MPRKFTPPLKKPIRKTVKTKLVISTPVVLPKPPLPAPRVTIPPFPPKPIILPHPVVEAPIVQLKDVGGGWKAVPVGSPIKSYFQYYALHLDRPDWILGSFFTSDKRTHDGKANYRAPDSLGAWMSILIPVAKKHSRKLFRKLNGVK